MSNHICPGCGRGTPSEPSVLELKDLMGHPLVRIELCSPCGERLSGPALLDWLRENLL